jgi:sensor histidine kinase regulating citrate/malate metabolism
MQNLRVPILSIVREKKLEIQTLEFEFLTEIPNLTAYFNTLDLQRMISNIINNTSEATQGKGKVQILFELEPHAVKLTLQDNGPGIPKSTLQSIMSPDSKPILSQTPGGCGIGLLHAKETLSSWGGQLFIENNLKSLGTRVILEIPLKPQSAAELTVSTHQKGFL